jgi:hypothetical protein
MRKNKDKVSSIYFYKATYKDFMHFFQMFLLKKTVIFHVMSSIFFVLKLVNLSLCAGLGNHSCYTEISFYLIVVYSCFTFGVSQI